MHVNNPLPDRAARRTAPGGISLNFPVRKMLAILALGVYAATAGAQTRLDEEADEQNKPWQEIAAQLPPMPAPQNLAPFYVSPTATQTFAIDLASVSVGSDNVVRYTMVTTSTEGAKNISYEGLRCQSREKKLYAFGHADGSWSRSRRDQWERMPQNAANRQHYALAQDYFCQGGIVAGNATDIVKRLRENRPFSNNVN